MSVPASGFVETARDWLMAPRTLTMQEAETIIGYLVNEIDLLRSTALDLRAELDAVRTVIPADFFDSLDAQDREEVVSEPYRSIRTALRTRQVDITMQEDVRANQRRLVEVDDAGNVVGEWVEKRP